MAQNSPPGIWYPGKGTSRAAGSRVIASFIHLRSAGCSVVLEQDDGGLPIWRYWGPRLEDGVRPPRAIAAERPKRSFSLDTDGPLTVFPTFGVGWFEQSALLAHRGGPHFEQSFGGVEVEWLVADKAVRFSTRDDSALIGLIVTLRLEGDALTLLSELTNFGATALDVQWLAAGVVPLPADALAVRSYGGRHLGEFTLQVDALQRGVWRRENRRGLTSHNDFPGAVVVTGATTAHEGRAYGAQLAWSGNHVQSIEGLDDGRFQWQMGAWLAPGEGRLAPGGVLVSPEMVATCSAQGLNGVARNFHRAARARIAWPGGGMKPRPVSFNTWEGSYFDQRLDALKSEADIAAALGVERFVLDDGWFHRRHNDRGSLGDWWPDEGKYPEGLGPLIAHVRGLGLEFGLWVEPEMVNPDSNLYRAHPQWALQIAGRPQVTGRNQLVLDMTRPDVTDYLFDRIDTLLGDDSISYLKWDHNRELAMAGKADGIAAYSDQVRATYALLDRLRSTHPDVEIESCAGGGGRIDLGILSRTHRFWTSDCIDARSRVAIQRGFLQFMPPEVMGAHVGASPAHTTSRRQSMEFRAATALPGHFGVELNLGKLDEAERAELKDWIDLYKTSRRRLHNGQVWLGEGADGLLWQAHGDPAARDVLLLVTRLDSHALRHSPPLRLPMVDRAGRYMVTPLRSRAKPYEVAGAWLVEVGLAVAPMQAEQCRLFQLARVD